MSAHEQIDGSNEFSSIHYKSDESIETNQEDVGDQKSCKEIFLWILGFAMAAKTIYRWNDIKIKAHGFLIIMVIVDVMLFTFANLGSSGSIFKAIPYAVSRNITLIAIVIGCSMLRVKLFASNQSTNSSDSEAKNDLESGSDIIEETDGIVVKTIVITYLGGQVWLKRICSNTTRQIVWFVFPALMYLALAVIFLFSGWMCSGDGWTGATYTASFRYFWFWMRDAMGWSVLLSILAIPGFDGAGLLTLLMKEYGYGQTAISFTIVAFSAVFVLGSGIYGFIPPFNAFAIYLTVYCGLKLAQYVSDPKNENMRVLRTLAKNSKMTSGVEILG